MKKEIDFFTSTRINFKSENFFLLGRREGGVFVLNET